MAGAADTLVLLYPYPAVEQSGDASELTTVNTLANYWQRVGLVPIDAHPEFLGQSTAYTALPEARRALGSVEDVEISVPASRICGDPDVGPCNGHMDNPHLVDVTEVTRHGVLNQRGVVMR
jgi:hypothetical protein